MEMFGWMVLMTCIEAIALTLLRIGGTIPILAAAVIYSVGVVPLLVKALSFEGVGLINFVWNIFSTLIMFAIGFLYFGERITPSKTAGVLISLLGIGILMITE